jgi:hypothetical protein
MKNTWKNLNMITGGLSNPSKMPCLSYGLPAIDSCPTGKKLSKIDNAICKYCYARKGLYQFPVVKLAQQRRLSFVTAALMTTAGTKLWIDCMVASIAKTKTEYFRPHDSGDFFSFEYMLAWIDVAILSPNVKFWFVTKERAMVYKLLNGGYTLPENIVIRLSDQMIGKESSIKSSHETITNCGTLTKKETIELKTTGKTERVGTICPAYKQDGFCKDCRKCWDKKEPRIWYPYH